MNYPDISGFKLLSTYTGYVLYSANIAYDESNNTHILKLVLVDPSTNQLHNVVFKPKSDTNGLYLDIEEVDEVTITADDFEDPYLALNNNKDIYWKER